jgi:hypothetical protein
MEFKQIPDLTVSYNPIGRRSVGGRKDGEMVCSKNVRVSGCNGEEANTEDKGEGEKRRKWKRTD